MRWSLIALLLLGCGDSGELAALKSSLANAQESIVETQATQIDKTDEAIGILRDNTTALAAIKSQIDSLEASIVSSKHEPGKDVDPASALESPQAKDANDSQPSTMIVAEPAGIRLASDGTRLRWNVEGNWDPTILETSRHLGEDHGINTDGMTHQEMADLHAAIHDGKPVAMKSKPVQFVTRGSSCPGGVCPTPRRGLFGRRR
jgi:hypothetical protein